MCHVEQRRGPDVVTHLTVIFFMVVKSMMLNDLNQECEKGGPAVNFMWSSACSCLVTESDLTALRVL